MNGGKQPRLFNPHFRNMSNFNGAPIHERGKGVSRCRSYLGATYFNGAPIHERGKA